MATIIEDFASYLIDEDRAPRTIDQYRSRLFSMERWVGKPVAEITSDDLQVFKRDAKERLASATIRGRIITFKVFRRWGENNGYFNSDGFEKVKPPKEQSRPILPLPLWKVRALLAEAQSPLEVRGIYLGNYEGLRVAESAAVRPEDWQDGWIQVNGKGRKYREVPVHPAVEAVRERIFEHPAPHRESVRKAAVRVAHRLGFHCGTQQFRKSFATTLIDIGSEGHVVDQMLGHTPNVRSRYVFVSRRRMEETIFPLTFQDFPDAPLSTPPPSRAASRDAGSWPMRSQVQAAGPERGDF
jgi:site-specific recombinase XerD